MIIEGVRAGANSGQTYPVFSPAAGESVEVVHGLV